MVYVSKFWMAIIFLIIFGFVVILIYRDDMLTRRCQAAERRADYWRSIAKEKALNPLIREFKQEFPTGEAKQKAITSAELRARAIKPKQITDLNES